MSIIVQKFGGTSVADSQKILAAARKAIRAQMDGHQVVVVVSAMGKNTDVLVQLAREITEVPSAREMDMLLSTGEQVSVALMAMAVHSLGHEAISLTGAQIGIVTDSTHTRARIHSISTERIQRALDEGRIVIAAGFQGVDEVGNITTLGRGGSDTTAVALAAVLGAEVCEIYTDVDGVYTADPRVVPEARRLARISYDEMLELASMGAGVMHGRSIEFAKKFSVPVHVRSSFSDSVGTVIGAEPEAPGQPVCGAALMRHEARITVIGVPDRPGAALTVFSRIAARNVTMDMIVQNVGSRGTADISLTVPRDDLPATMKAIEEAVHDLGAGSFSYDDDVSKISVVGLGMATQPGVARRMFRTLGERGINIQMITTGQIKLSVLLDHEHSQEALRLLHHAFGLEEVPPLPEVAPELTVRSGGPVAAANAVARMQSMEELMIGGIDLDESQARLTLADVPDRPGLAAAVFEEVAAGGIVVDMIVQSIGRAGKAGLSFTIPREDLDRGLALAGAIAKRLGCPPPAHCPEVAKLSVTGIGMRSHTGVARRMFQTLSRTGVNIDMISTSEVQVNVVVDAKMGRKSHSALQQEFAEVIV